MPTTPEKETVGYCHAVASQNHCAVIAGRDVDVSHACAQRWDSSLVVWITPASHNSAVASEQHSMSMAYCNLCVDQSGGQVWNEVLSKLKGIVFEAQVSTPPVFEVPVCSAIDCCTAALKKDRA
eukprot:581201-Pyramimonas_sp.AAC.1